MGTRIIYGQRHICPSCGLPTIFVPNKDGRYDGEHQSPYNKHSKEYCSICGENLCQMCIGRYGCCKQHYDQFPAEIKRKIDNARTAYKIAMIVLFPIFLIPFFLAILFPLLFLVGLIGFFADICVVSNVFGLPKKIAVKTWKKTNQQITMKQAPILQPSTRCPSCGGEVSSGICFGCGAKVCQRCGHANMNPDSGHCESCGIEI